MSDTIHNSETKLLGDVIKSLITSELQYLMGWGKPNKENQIDSETLVEALNQFELVISYECDIDGDGDIDKDDMQVDLIHKVAKSRLKKGVSCCRIQPRKSSSLQVGDTIVEDNLGEPENTETVSKKKKKKRSTSRR